MRRILSELQMQRGSCVRLAQLFVPCSSPGPSVPATLRGCAVSLGLSKQRHSNPSCSGHQGASSAVNQLRAIKLMLGFSGGRQTT